MVWGVVEWALVTVAATVCNILCPYARGSCMHGRLRVHPQQVTSRLLGVGACCAGLPVLRAACSASVCCAWFLGAQALAVMSTTQLLEVMLRMFTWNACSSCTVAKEGGCHWAGSSAVAQHKGVRHSSWPQESSNVVVEGSVQIN